MLWSVELQAKYSGLCNFKKNTRINFNSCQGAEIEIDYYFQLQIDHCCWSVEICLNMTLAAPIEIAI